MTFCKWCGKPLKKINSNAQIYHENCKKEALKESKSKWFRKYYKIYKKNKIQTFNSYKNSLRTGSLPSVHNSDTSKEYQSIKKEKRRFKIS